MLELQQESHRPGRGDRLVHASVAPLLEPVIMSDIPTRQAFVMHTVKGRTRIATLMDEAPSEAAMLNKRVSVACALSFDAA